jgi:hypothetical protein
MGNVRATLGLIIACVVVGAARGQAPTDAALPVTPEKLALAQRIVVLNGSQANGARMMDVLTTQMTKSMQATAADPALAEYVGKLVHEEVALMQDKLGATYAEIYARSFTDQQLIDLLTFYSSPTGRMLVAKTPTVIQQSQLAVAPLLPGMQRDLIEKLFGHICEMKHCNAEQRRQMSEAKAKILDRLNQQQGQAAAEAATQAAMKR